MGNAELLGAAIFQKISENKKAYLVSDFDVIILWYDWIQNVDMWIAFHGSV